MKGVKDVVWTEIFEPVDSPSELRRYSTTDTSSGAWEDGHRRLVSPGNDPSQNARDIQRFF